ncbi:type II secretion system protein [Kitasatospora sp. NPDC004289]
MTAHRPPGHPESGFTLTELLVTIVIVGIIATLLPTAVLLGLRFTAGTEKRVAASGATGALTRYFHGDVQSADGVTTTPACGAADPIVHLTRTGTDVVYAYDPASGALTRLSCTGGVVATKALGRFDNAAVTRPVTLTCGAEISCTSPLEVTLTVRTDPAAPPTTLTAVRRVGTS